MPSLESQVTTVPQESTAEIARLFQFSAMQMCSCPRCGCEYIGRSTVEEVCYSPIRWIVLYMAEAVSVHLCEVHVI